MSREIETFSAGDLVEFVNGQEVGKVLVVDREAGGYDEYYLRDMGAEDGDWCYMANAISLKGVK